jgi:DNA-binding NarL/FixJ family response regulator
VTGGTDPSDDPLRVLIVDDQEISRTGTRHLLSAVADIVVLGETTGPKALAMIDELQPDVVLIDVQRADPSGIDVARRVSTSHPATRIVILSADDDDQLVRRSLEAGVAGYLLKTIPKQKLISAVRTAGMGTTVLDPGALARLTSWSNIKRVGDGHDVSVRERQIIALIGEGLSNKAIAAELGLSARTIEGHINHIYIKLGVESRTSLVRYALTHDLAP